MIYINNQGQNKDFLSASFPNFKKKKNIFLVDNQTSLSPFSMLKDAPCTLSHGYNIEKGRGGRHVTIQSEIEKLTRSTKLVFFGVCFNCFCP